MSKNLQVGTLPNESFMKVYSFHACKSTFKLFIPKPLKELQMFSA